MNIRDIAEQVHKIAEEKGWWVEERSLGDQFANFHAEISEAWEEWRSGREMYEIYYVNGKPEGVPIELADCIIRILDTCVAYGIDIESALRQKIEYNLKRPFRHGGKKA